MPVSYVSPRPPPLRTCRTQTAAPDSPPLLGMHSQVAAAPTAQVVLLTAAGFLFYACGYLFLWFSAGLDVHELQPAGAYGNTTASLSPSRPTEVHYLYLWMDSHFDAEVLRHMSYAADVIAPPVMHSPEYIQTLAVQFDAVVPGFSATYQAIPRIVTKTDVARLLAVYFHGGVYLDTDVVARRTFDLAPNGTWFVEKTVSVTKLGPREEPHSVRVANYAFGAQKRSPLVALMLAEAARRCRLLATKHGGRGGYKWSDTDITWASPDPSPSPSPSPSPDPNPNPNPDPDH